MKILVVDDEKLIVKGLKFALEQDGTEVDCAYDGDEALEMARKGQYDCILLDVMLPGRNGVEVCGLIRESSHVPIIMVTAKGEDEDKILGLDSGADDYITKPFNILEVKARIKAVLRRNSFGAAGASGGGAPRIINIRGMEIDIDNEALRIKGRDVSLTSREFDVLALLATNPGKVYSRENLLSIIWGEDYPGDVRTVDVHIRRLREKVEEKPGEPEYIHTKWGTGYYFK